MKNKIVGIIYFICLAILFSTASAVYSIEKEPSSPKIIGSISKTTEIESLFKTNLKEYSEIITYSIEPRGLVLSIDSSVFFTHGSTEIIEKSKDFLDTIGYTIKNIDNLCVIEGNANLPNLTGYTNDSNWEISNAQAQKLSSYLISVHNIHPNKIRAIGFGASTPSKIIQRIDFVILNYGGK